MKFVGQRLRPIDWDARSAGAVAYAGDVLPDNCLTGRILRSPHPLARIIEIDTSAALRLPGVHAAITDLAPSANETSNLRICTNE